MTKKLSVDDYADRYAGEPSLSNRVDVHIALRAPAEPDPEQEEIAMAWGMTLDTLLATPGKRAAHLLKGLAEVEAQCNSERRPLPRSVPIGGEEFEVAPEMLGEMAALPGFDAVLSSFSRRKVTVLPPVREQAPQAAEVMQPAPAKGGPVLAPVQVSTAQESALLVAIQEAGYAPKSLPRNKSGRPGVKAELRAKLKNHRLFVGEKKFDKAWERLRASGDIGDSSSPALG